MSGGIDFDSHIPYYVQLMGLLVDQINCKDLKPGDPLARESDLCERYGVSRTVVRWALCGMELNGLVIRQKGRGTFIAEPKISESLAPQLTGFYQDMIGRGFKPIAKILNHQIISFDEKITHYLGNPIGAKAFELTRLRFIKTEPLQLVSTSIPFSIRPQLE